MLGMALIIVVLMLGIGYAALTTTNLFVTGNVNVTKNDNNFKVSYDRDKVPTVSDSAKATAAYTDEKNATLSVTGLVVKGDKVTATYTIHNESTDLLANLAKENITVTDANTAETTDNGLDDTQYFQVTSEIGASQIGAGESTTVTVTVELLKTPIQNVGVTINVPFTATAEEAKAKA